MKKNLTLAIAGKKVKGRDSAQELTTQRVLVVALTLQVASVEIDAIS